MYIKTIISVYFSTVSSYFHVWSKCWNIWLLKTKQNSVHTEEFVYYIIYIKLGKIPLNKNSHVFEPSVIAAVKQNTFFHVSWVKYIYIYICIAYKDRRVSGTRFREFFIHGNITGKFLRSRRRQKIMNTDVNHYYYFFWTCIIIVTVTVKKWL